jgi:hypothetical protein
MSEKLYLQRPGQKPLELSFTADDLPILKEWYELKFPGPVKPKFEELELSWKNMFAKSGSFGMYRVRYRWRELRTAIKTEFNKPITTIKSFFRCTKN